MVHSELILWKFISDRLSAGVSCMLLLVVDHQDSSPGRQGFKMAVSSSFELCGSIGGGIMEHKLVELSLQQLKNNVKSISLKKQIHKDSIAQDKSGMICSGEQTVAFVPLYEDHLSLVEQITQYLSTGDEVILEVTATEISINLESIASVAGLQKFNLDPSWCYREQLGYKHFLHIVGGGHISLALSKLAADLDFHITVYDDREQLNTMKLNQYAHQLEQVTYTQLPIIDPKHLNYVIIMSFGYRTDKQILESLHPQQFDYLGLLGSQAKIDVLFNELRSEGMDPQWIQQIEAPVGIPISSQTPTEIAVSIAASLIKSRQSSLQRGSL